MLFIGIRVKSASGQVGLSQLGRVNSAGLSRPGPIYIFGRDCVNGQNMCSSVLLKTELKSDETCTVHLLF